MTSEPRDPSATPPTGDFTSSKGESLTPRADELLARLEHFGVKLGLDRIRALLDDLGRPHLAVPVVLVAGTNGKGSTAAMLASAARAAGYRTGLFVSPHLESLAERISVAGEPITDDALHGHLEEILEKAETMQKEPPTFFEAMTLSAFLHYRSEDCDLAVMEVGLGGRLDATNVSEPIISVITSIGLDHQNQLGSTLAAIAGEKAGIARTGKPLLAWAEPDEVHEALEERCRALDARYVPAQEHVTIEPRRRAASRTPGAGLEGRITTPSDVYRARLSLPGRHQLRNFALVALAAEELQSLGFDRLDRDAVERGAADTVWPARLEWVHLDDGRRALLDAGHNPAGITTLLEHLDEELNEDDEMHLLFGVVGDKSVPEMLPPLAQRARRIVLSRPPSHRAGDPADWLAHVEGHGDVEVIEDPADALGHTLGRLPAGGVLVATGSIYLLGEVRRELRRLTGVPAATVPGG